MKKYDKLRNYMKDNYSDEFIEKICEKADEIVEELEASFKCSRCGRSISEDELISTDGFCYACSDELLSEIAWNEYV